MVDVVVVLAMAGIGQEQKWEAEVEAEVELAEVADVVGSCCCGVVIQKLALLSSSCFCPSAGKLLCVTKVLSVITVALLLKRLRIAVR